MAQNAAIANNPQGFFSTDPDHFNEHVTPDLETAIGCYASCVRSGLAGYSLAFDRVMLCAVRRGAWGFAAAHREDLESWVHDTLTAAIERAPADPEG